MACRGVRRAGTRYSAFDDVNRGLAPGEAPTDRSRYGGRCGARAQSYSVRITCARWCGEAVRTASPARRPAVLAGAGTPADVSFG